VLTPDQARTIAALAEVDVNEDELPGFVRALERVRAFAAAVRELDVEGVTPWTPPS
jgi:Asp-tRNA(Asn)/Glu-tRNA(Gln) amidotransferase C subunit